MSKSSSRAQQSSSCGGSSRWAILAGATAALTAIAATGYLVYGYSTGWKGPAYSFWCPERRKKRKVQSPFFAQVDQCSESLEVDARAWMERYV